MIRIPSVQMQVEGGDSIVRPSFPLPEGNLLVAFDGPSGDYLVYEAGDTLPQFENGLPIIGEE